MIIIIIITIIMYYFLQHGGKVSALLPHSKKLHGLNPGSARVSMVFLRGLRLPLSKDRCLDNWRIVGR